MDECKICGGARLLRRAHTARCVACGVLLYYPYPTEIDLVPDPSKAQAATDAWYHKAARRNHHNFTHMLAFALAEGDYDRDLKVLDYGGGGGQFAMVCRSMLPRAKVWLADISDNRLLDLYRPQVSQIPWATFEADRTKFDLIMLNDVYEHVSDPIAVLRLLKGKLAPGGKIFIDTPKQFWLYPLLKAIAPGLYVKLLRGTVSLAHLQIWSPKSFRLSAQRAGLDVIRYREVSEFTMAPEFYLRNMRIANSATVFLANTFYRMAKLVSTNKILAVLS